MKRSNELLAFGILVSDEVRTVRCVRRVSVCNVGAGQQFVGQRQNRRYRSIVTSQPIALNPRALPVLRQELPVRAGKFIDTLVRITRSMRPEHQP